MIWTNNNPAAKTVAQVDDPDTADETDDIRKRCPECQDEDLGKRQKTFGFESI